MTFQLYPTVTFLVIFFNFLTWFWQGQILFNWLHLLWIIPGEWLIAYIAQEIQMRGFKKWNK